MAVEYVFVRAVTRKFGYELISLLCCFDFASCPPPWVRDLYVTMRHQLELFQCFRLAFWHLIRVLSGRLFTSTNSMFWLLSFWFFAPPLRAH